MAMPSAVAPPTLEATGLRSWSWIALAIAAGVVLSIYLWLASYAYPVSDDWFQASSGRDNGVLASLASYWQGTGGRWFMALLVYGLGVFPDLPAVYPLLVLFNLVFLLAAGSFVAVAWGARGTRPVLLVTAVLGAVQFTALPILEVGNLGPHAAAPETLYWLSGSWPYAGAYPLLALAAWCVRDDSPRWLSWSACLVLGLLVSGLSEMAAVAGVVLGAALGMGGLRRGWILAAAAGIGFVLTLLAPGNLNRLAMLRQEVQADAGVASLPSAMIASLRFTGVHVRDWLCNPAIAIAAALLLLGGCRLPAGPGPWRRRAGIALAATLLGVWAMAVPTLALVGFLEARHEGLVSLWAVAGLLTTAVLAGRAWPELAGSTLARRLAVGWIAVAVVVRLCWPAPISPLGPWSGLLAAAVLLVPLLLWLRDISWAPVVLLALAVLWQPAWWQALADASGKAPAMAGRQQARDRVVRALVESGQRHIVVPWLGDPGEQPRTIRLYEVQPGWMADGYAAYFRIDKLIISERVDTPRPARLRPAPPAAP